MAHTIYLHTNRRVCTASTSEMETAVALNVEIGDVSLSVFFHRAELQQIQRAVVALNEAFATEIEEVKEAAE